MSVPVSPYILFNLEIVFHCKGYIRLREGQGKSRGGRVRPRALGLALGCLTHPSGVIKSCSGDLWNLPLWNYYFFNGRNFHFLGLFKRVLALGQGNKSDDLERVSFHDYKILMDL